MTNRFQQSVTFLKENGFGKAEIGIVLGTGLHELVYKIEVEAIVDYAAIPHFPISTVESHTGKLIYGNIHGKKVIAMQGRFHLYEGYTIDQVVFPIEVMKLLGINLLILSNAAGSLNLAWKKGDLMILTNHINLQDEIPTNYSFSIRKSPMINPYDFELSQLLKSIAQELQMLLREGVYVAVKGPMLETRSEYRFLRKIGGDAVGMSTVPEVICAQNNNIRYVAISVLTDECDPENLKPVSLKEIIYVAQKADQKLTDLFYNFIRKI